MDNEQHAADIIVAQPQSLDPASPQPPRMRKTSLVFILFMGVFLPAFTLGFEWSTHMSGEAFFDPIPTVLHGLLIASVPLANALLCLALYRGSVAHAASLARLNAFAIGIALFYTLLYLPLTPIAPIAIIWLGIGLLPLAPILSLSAAVWGRRLLKHMAGDLGSADSVPHAWAGLALALAALIAVDLPFTLTRAGLQMAASDSASSHVLGLRWLRAIGNEKLMLRLCYAQSGMSTDLLGMLFNLHDSVTPEQARTVFFQVTGSAFNDRPAPLKRGLRDWSRTLDDDTGGAKVGRHAAGVKLASSRIDGSVDAQATTGYLEWTMVFRNDADSQQEGRGQIALPPGAVVSRLTLWIDGEEREAAFGGRAQVRQAYEKVVRRQRDPVLVTTAGKDRVLFQLFPIPPHGGEMKIKIGITAPMALSDLRQARLQLPSFRERNFEIAENIAHTVWLESSTPLEGIGALKSEHADARRYALRGELSDARLKQPEAVIAAQRNPLTRAVWSTDSKAGEGVMVVQRYREQPAWMPQRAVLVIDGSRSMRDEKDQIAEALARFPASVELGVVIASDMQQERPDLIAMDWTAAAQRIRNFSFEGGRDNLAALASAWDWAAEKPNGAIVWIHGPQPLPAGTIEPLLQRYERRPHQVKLYDIEAVAGANRILEKLDAWHDVTAVARSGTLRDDLVLLFRQWQPGAIQIAVVRETAMRAAGQWQVSAQTSDHIARLWAADQVASLSAQRGEAARQSAIAVARRYQLVTPVSGAVVLETREQYQEAGLEPVAAGSVPTIPEPETWMLIIVVLGLLTWQYRRMRAER